jgi:hypothetical protein
VTVRPAVAADLIVKEIPFGLGLKFLGDLAVAENNLSLIEEPEHHFHPSGLRRFLEMQVQSSATNQSITSTHSNIALRHRVGAEGCRYSGYGFGSQQPPSICSFVTLWLSSTTRRWDAARRCRSPKLS